MSVVKQGKKGVVERYRQLVEPQENGLPQRRVIAYPLLFLAALFLVFVGLGVTGSSTGMLNQFFSNSSDDRLILGEPQAIRSDEWSVQTSWTISQVEQGLPSVNQIFPGGMDATVQHDLPSADWSVAFRPHLLGFLFLPLDNAMAFKWWLPGFGMIAAAYLFFIGIMPRRPLASSALATGLFFAPFVQWWYLSVTTWAIAWAFLVMAAVLWAVKGASVGARVTLAILAGYITVTLGTGIYVPFILAGVFPALAFSVGYTLDKSSNRFQPFIRKRFHSLLPLLISGVAGVGVLGIWLLTRWSTIQGFMNTVYPGERLTPTGAMEISQWMALLAAPFNYGLQEEQNGSLGANAAEASTLFINGLFLLIPLIWIAVRRFRCSREIDAVTLSMSILMIVCLLFLAVPGWDPIAHLLFLDRFTPERMYLLFGIVSIMLMAILAMRVEELRQEKARKLKLIFPALCATLVAGLSLSTVALWLRLHKSIIISPKLFGFDSFVTLAVLCVLFLAVVWLSSVGRITWGATIFLVMSFITTLGVNPLYRGVYSLTDTPLLQTMREVQGDSDGRWVGVDASTPINVALVQSGLPGYNGFQSAPAPEMWDQIDPEKQYEYAWNRLANVSWVVGEGEPSVTNPHADQIRVTFDSCSSFAQENVSFVLSESELEQSCVRLVDTVQAGPSTFRIYRTVEQPQ
ncbi:hypothetical protein [Lysinibacter sp. HNR]|uniref:DUF7657 domain-containing protein n=1 Tax=Lysinibacter sp. HNR TaxID=3031408 RepID=UPI002436129A|nr:hypothetical protein [Lysinibacter sp. HNR]WGD38061.1 hypothetical protein FrondiHNR_03855 [Lysinibacter sp. HNR]